ERRWAVGLLQELDLPTRLLPELIEPGTILGALKPSVHTGLGGTPVVAPACHDTGSAVAALPGGAGRGFLSLGTWSLLGTETAVPVITPAALQANFTNEGGVCGTTRLLKNIGELWPLQACRHGGAREGRSYDSAERMDAAADDRHAFLSLFDPDDPVFLRPPDMALAIADYCRRTEQPQPKPPGAFTRAILESLAFKYRLVLDTLEELTGTAITEVQVVGGGSRNRLLNQFTADATGRSIVAGPVEATALGNIAMQMLATGAVSTLAEARRIIEYSFPADRFEPAAADQWDAQYARFRGYVELTCVCIFNPGNVPAAEPLGGARRGRARRQSPRAAALPVEPARRGPPHHQLRRRQHQLEVRSPRSADRRITPGDGSEGQWRGPAVDYRIRLRPAVSRPARLARHALSRRSARRRDGRAVSAVRVRRQHRGGAQHHPAP